MIFFESVIIMSYSKMTKKELINLIEKLNEENKKLKRDIDGDGWLYEGYKKELSNQFKIQKRWCTDNVQLKKKNILLREENKHLLEQLNKVTEQSQKQYEREMNLYNEKNNRT